jgi:hypothetical protein
MAGMVSVSTSGTLDTAALTRSMTQANRAVGRELGRVAAKATTAAVKAGPGAGLSGMRVKLGAKAKVFAGAARVTVDVTATPPGPWSIREFGRGPVRARGRALAIPGRPRKSARAAKGRRGTWDSAVDRSAPEIERAIAAVYDETLET